MNSHLIRCYSLSKPLIRMKIVWIKFRHSHRVYNLNMRSMFQYLRLRSSTQKVPIHATWTRKRYMAKHIQIGSIHHRETIYLIQSRFAYEQIFVVLPMLYHSNANIHTSPRDYPDFAIYALNRSGVELIVRSLIYIII